jgi:hypothetical protein
MAAAIIITVMIMTTGIIMVLTPATHMKRA